jgi:pimeloyl-ACP methyl ester carboxylesterase
VTIIRQYNVPVPDETTATGKRYVAISEWGNSDNKDILFCVHGLSRNARDFDFLARTMSKDYRVIAVDIVGRGKSEWLKDAQRYTYETYVNDCLFVLKALDIKHVNWLGTSMGGLIGMFIAVKAPEMIYRLILNDIGPHIPSASLRRILKYVQNTKFYDSKEAIEATLRIKLSTFGLTSEEHWQHMLAHTIRQTEAGLYCFDYDPAIIKKPLPGQEIPDIELFDLWYAVSHPTLVLRGALSDILRHETAMVMERTGPLPKVVVIEGVGHAPALMEDAQIQVIREWLSDVF